MLLFNKKLTVILLLVLFLHRAPPIYQRVYTYVEVEEDIPFDEMYLKYGVEVFTAEGELVGERYSLFTKTDNPDTMMILTKLYMEGELVEDYWKIITVKDRVIVASEKYPETVGMICWELAPLPLHIGASFNWTDPETGLTTEYARITGSTVIEIMGKPCECWILQGESEVKLIEKTTGITVADYIEEPGSIYGYRITCELVDTNVESFPPTSAFIQRFSRLLQFALPLGVILLALCPASLVLRRKMRNIRVFLGLATLALIVLPILLHLGNYVVIPVNVSPNSIEHQISYFTIASTILLIIAALLSWRFLAFLASTYGVLFTLYALSFYSTDAASTYLYTASQYNFYSMIGMAVISSLFWFSTCYITIKFVEVIKGKLTGKPSPPSTSTPQHKVEEEEAQHSMEEVSKGDYEGTVKEQASIETLAPKPALKTCSYCGAKVQPDYTYCPNCGAKMEKEKELKELLECPMCKAKVNPGEEFCPSCGYYFEAGIEGAGPFNFAFPTVEIAYEPSGKGSFSGNVWMLLSGMLAGFCSGLASSIITLILLVLVFYLFSLFFQEGGWKLGLGAFILFFASPYFAGMLLGYTISKVLDKVALRVKSRSLKAVRRIGYVSAIIGYLVYVLFSYYLLSSVIKMEWWYLIVNMALSLWGVKTEIKNLGEAIKKTPFCEACGKYMKKSTLKKVPIHFEGDLMKVLKSRRFEDIVSFPSAAREDINYSEVSVWYCDTCMQGIINAETTQTRYMYEKDGRVKGTVSATRLIFSSPLEKSEAEKIVKLLPT